MRVLAALAVLSLLAGCSEPASPAPLARADPSAPAPGVGGVRTQTSHNEWTAAVGASDQSVALVGSGSTVVDVYPDGLNGTLVEMAWTPSSPLSEQMKLLVTREGTVLGAASGPSPLRVLLDGQSGVGQLLLEGTPADPGGAYIDQGYELHVTTFKHVPFDPAFTALGP